MLKTGALLLVTAGSALAFTPLGLFPSGPGVKLRSASGHVAFRMSEALDQDPDPHGRTKTQGTGFEGGEELRRKELARRAAAGQETMGGGAAGSSKMEEGQSFEEYMKSRAEKTGGQVTDLAGNDITGVKPSYEVVDFMTYMYTDPKDQRKEAGAVSSWEVDRSVTGFQKESTDWLTEDDESGEMSEWAANKKKEDEEAAAAAEAKMQMWLKAAADKKAAEGN